MLYYFVFWLICVLASLALSYFSYKNAVGYSVNQYFVKVFDLEEVITEMLIGLVITLSIGTLFSLPLGTAYFKTEDVSITKNELVPLEGSKKVGRSSFFKSKTIDGRFYYIFFMKRGSGGHKRFEIKTDKVNFHYYDRTKDKKPRVIVQQTKIQKEYTNWFFFKWMVLDAAIGLGEKTYNAYIPKETKN